MQDAGVLQKFAIDSLRQVASDFRGFVALRALLDEFCAEVASDFLVEKFSEKSHTVCRIYPTRYNSRMAASSRVLMA